MRNSLSWEKNECGDVEIVIFLFSNDNVDSVEIDGRGKPEMQE